MRQRNGNMKKLCSDIKKINGQSEDVSLHKRCNKTDTMAAAKACTKRGTKERQF